MPLSFDGTKYIKTPDTQEGNGYKPLPEGEHLLTCEDAEIQENEKGILAEFTWLVGDSKRKVWDKLYLDGDGVSPKAIEIGRERFSKLLTVCGLDPKFEDRKSANLLCSKMIGKQVAAKTKNSIYNGKTYTNVSSYKPVSKTQKDSW
jgi:hypothetical protein